MTMKNIKKFTAETLEPRTLLAAAFEAESFDHDPCADMYMVNDDGDSMVPSECYQSASTNDFSAYSEEYGDDDEFFNPDYYSDYYNQSEQLDSSNSTDSSEESLVTYLWNNLTWENVYTNGIKAAGLTLLQGTADLTLTEGLQVAHTLKAIKDSGAFSDAEYSDIEAKLTAPRMVSRKDVYNNLITEKYEPGSFINGITAVSEFTHKFSAYVLDNNGSWGEESWSLEQIKSALSTGYKFKKDEIADILERLEQAEAEKAVATSTDDTANEDGETGDFQVSATPSPIATPTPSAKIGFTPVTPTMEPVVSNSSSVTPSATPVPVTPTSTVSASSMPSMDQRQVVYYPNCSIWDAPEVQAFGFTPAPEFISSEAIDTEDGNSNDNIEVGELGSDHVIEFNNPFVAQSPIGGEFQSTIWDAPQVESVVVDEVLEPVAEVQLSAEEIQLQEAQTLIDIKVAGVNALSDAESKTEAGLNARLSLIESLEELVALQSEAGNAVEAQKTQFNVEARTAEYAALSAKAALDAGNATEAFEFASKAVEAREAASKIAVDLGWDKAASKQLKNASWPTKMKTQAFDLVKDQFDTKARQAEQAAKSAKTALDAGNATEAYELAEQAIEFRHEASDIASKIGLEESAAKQVKYTSWPTKLKAQAEKQLQA
ncbi:MAG: hypothetical protein Tsb0018_03260 [Opitutales bacterium]